MRFCFNHKIKFLTFINLDEYDNFLDDKIKFMIF